MPLYPFFCGDLGLDLLLTNLAVYRRLQKLFTLMTLGLENVYGRIRVLMGAFLHRSITSRSLGS